jgi:uncharacterized protein (TIGR03435 family)
MCSTAFSAAVRTGILLSVAVCAGYVATPLGCQGRDAFETVVIKRDENRVPPVARLETSARHLKARFASLHYLVTQAFGIDDYQIIETRDWMTSELYSIDATSGKAAGHAQMMAMLRNTLATRFLLAVHRETRLIPVYALVVDERGSRLAPLGQGDDGPKVFQTSGDRITESIGSTMQDLVRRLSSKTGPAVLDRPVVDRTGMQGLYRIWLTFDVQANSGGRGARLSIDYPSALISQLGLRLEPSNLAIEMLVVDRAERPRI